MTEALTLSPLTLVLSAGFGLLTFVSPCVLPLLPAYLGYMTGLSFQELRGERTAGLRWHILSRSVAFVLGLAVIFTIFGASATALGKTFLQNQTLLLQIGGAIIVVFGLHLTGLIRIPWLDVERRIGFGRAPAGYAGAFLMGASFGAGWTPCIGPFLGTLLTLAGSRDTVLEGSALLFAYALGLGIPFIIAGLALGTATSVLTALRRHMPVIKLVSGVLVMAMGVLIFTDRLSLLASWLTGTFGTGLAH